MDERFVLTDRRSFLKAVSIAGAGFSLVPQNGQGQVSGLDFALAADRKPILSSSV